MCFIQRFVPTIVLLVLLQIPATSTGNRNESPRIAVIGGGIGGAAASYMLHALFSSSGFQIDIYEAKEVGGRLAVVEVGGRNYEAGGSAINNGHRYMNRFAKILGLNRTKSTPGRVGIYNGQQYVFKENSYQLWTSLKQWVRYGWSTHHRSTLIDQMAANFERLYNHQEEGHSFTSLDKLLEAMNPKFIRLIKETTDFALDALKFNDLFIKEVALASTRLNYGQTTEINGLAGVLSLIETPASTWSVEGGNYQLSSGLITLSEANLVSSKAKKIILKDNGKYEIVTNVKHIDANQTKYVHRQIYDIVVIAAPQTRDLSSLTFEDFPSTVGNFSGRYHKTITTFVEGKLNYSYFHFEGEHDSVENVVMLDSSMLYNSISRTFPVDWLKETDQELTPVYKVCSPRVLSNEVLDAMFEIRTATKVVGWLAYPQYTDCDTLGTFQLHNRLYYTSAIECAGSSIEMSAIAATNVALLAYNQWYSRNNLIDHSRESKTLKQEL